MSSLAPLFCQARTVMQRLERRHEPIKTVSTRRLSLSILKNIDETQEVGDWTAGMGQVVFVLYDDLR